jgi:predicted RNA-binding protein
MPAQQYAYFIEFFKCQKPGPDNGRDFYGEMSTMCEANAYLVKDGKEELLLEALDTVEPDDGKLKLTSIFGEQKFVKGRISRLSLVDHKVIFEEVKG